MYITRQRILEKYHIRSYDFEYYNPMNGFCINSVSTTNERFKFLIAMAQQWAVEKNIREVNDYEIKNATKENRISVYPYDAGSTYDDNDISPLEISWNIYKKEGSFFRKFFLYVGFFHESKTEYLWFEFNDVTELRFFAQELGQFVVNANIVFKDGGEVIFRIGFYYEIEDIEIKIDSNDVKRFFNMLDEEDLERLIE